MLYTIITEKKEVFKVERVLGNVKREIVFADIEEETKYEQLQTAVFLRFNEDYFVNPDNKNQVFHKLTPSKWLKLIPQSDCTVGLDLPTLSLMA